MIEYLIGGGFSLGMGAIFLQVRAVSRKLDRIDEKHQECRESLPARFADKAQADHTFARLFEITDAHTKEISYQRGVRNGTK